MRRSRIILGWSLALLLAAALWVGFSIRPPGSPADLRGLAALQPVRQSVDEDGWVTLEFRQHLPEVERVLDASLTEANGWESGGADKLGYVWYHRIGWRGTVRGWLQSAGFHEGFVSIKEIRGPCVVEGWDHGMLLK